MGFTRQTNNRERSKAKKRKSFLERNDELELATAIVDLQEQEVSKKVEKAHPDKAVQSRSRAEPKTHSLTSNKNKLKETKALLAAQKARFKREKLKERKKQAQETRASLTHILGSNTASQQGARKKDRKSVSFA